MEEKNRYVNTVKQKILVNNSLLSKNLSATKAEQTFLDKQKLKKLKLGGC